MREAGRVNKAYLSHRPGEQAEQMKQGRNSDKSVRSEKCRGMVHELKRAWVCCGELMEEVDEMVGRKPDGRQQATHSGTPGRRACAIKSTLQIENRMRHHDKSSDCFCLKITQSQ